MDFFSNIWKALSGAGQSVGKAVGGFAQQAMPGLGGLFNMGQQGVQKAGQGLGNLFGSGGQAPNVAQTAQKTASAVAPATQSPVSMFQPPQLSTSQLKSNPAAQYAQQKGAGVAMPSVTSAFTPPKPIQQQIPQVAQQAAQQVPQAASAPAQAPAAKPMLGGIFGNNPMQTAIGAGMPMAMQMFSRQPKVPDLSQLPSYQALKGVQFQNFKEMDPALETALNNDLKKLEDDELQQMQASYKNLRPGADIESDSKYAQDTQDLRDKQASRRMDLMAKARFEAIQQQIGANAQEMQKLIQLANLDTQQIGIQLGIDAQAAQNFQELFGSLGRTMVSSSYGMNNPVSVSFGGGK